MLHGGRAAGASVAIQSGAARAAAAAARVSTLAQLPRALVAHALLVLVVALPLVGDADGLNAVAADLAVALRGSRFRCLQRRGNTSALIRQCILAHLHNLLPKLSGT